jgi:hypothetical protein
MKNLFSRGSNKFNLDHYTIGSRDDMNRLTLHGDFSLNDYAKKSADEWFVNLNLLRIYQGEEIDFPKRKMPIEKEFLFKNKYVVVLKIPEGYTASYVPRSRSFKNNMWGFDLSYVVDKDKLVYTLDVYNDHLMINADNFEQWNKVLEQLSPQYKEIVILSKK